MQSYSSAVPIDIPITLRSLRKITGLAVRNAHANTSNSGNCRIGIYANDKEVYRREVESHELNNGTMNIFEGSMELSVASFVVRGFCEDAEVWKYEVALDKDFVDVGTALDAFSMPEGAFLFVRLANGVWTSNQTSLNAHVPYITPMVSHIEPRFLSYSWILDSMRVVQRLIEAKNTVAADLAQVKQQLFDRHEVTMKKTRRKIVLARTACEEKSMTVERLEREVAAMESTLFHKRNSYEARLRSLQNTIDSHPIKEIPFNELRTLEEGRRILAERKLERLRAVMPIERSQKIFTINKFPFSKFNPDIRNEEGYSAALGLIVLTVSVLSVILDIPVRPHLSFCGSRSTLTDLMTETQLPLFYRGVEKSDYIRGLELLHDSICELLVVSGRGEGRSAEILADIYRLVTCDRVEDIW